MLGLIACLLCMAAFLLSTAASARVYKCKDADGNITYSQTTCSASSEHKLLMGQGPNGVMISAMPGR